MYTKFVFGCSLKNDTPDNVINVLDYLINKPMFSHAGFIPNHQFFKCDRWRFISSCSSCYFGAPSCSVLKYDSSIKSWSISIRANLKNYDNEIDKFVDWIRPYINYGAGSKELLGYSIYEDAEEPKLYYL